MNPWIRKTSIFRLLLVFLPNIVVGIFCLMTVLVLSSWVLIHKNMIERRTLMDVQISLTPLPDVPDDVLDGLSTFAKQSQKLSRWKSTAYSLKLILQPYPSNDVTTMKQCKTKKWSFYFLNQILGCRQLITAYIRVDVGIYSPKL